MSRLLPAPRLQPRLQLLLPLPLTSPPVPLAPPSSLSTPLAAAPAPGETAPFLLQLAGPSPLLPQRAPVVFLSLMAQRARLNSALLPLLPV